MSGLKEQWEIVSYSKKPYKNKELERFYIKQNDGQLRSLAEDSQFKKDFPSALSLHRCYFHPQLSELIEASIASVR